MPDVRSIGADLARVPARPCATTAVPLPEPEVFFRYLARFVLILIVGAFLVRSAVGRAGPAAQIA